MSARREGVYNEQHQICVLLHEMTHAFVDIFSCHKKCCRKKLQRPDWGTGKGGHGNVWCSSMVAIESAFRPIVRWPVTYSIPESVALEMISGCQPREEQLVRWGLSLAALQARNSNRCSTCLSRHGSEDEDGDHVDEECDDDEEDDEWEYVLCCTIL